MHDDRSEENSPVKMILAQALKMVGCTPYWWRQDLEEIAAGIESGQVPRKISSRLLSETLAELQTDLTDDKLHVNPAVRSALKEHFEIGLKETHEFAEAHQLAISQATRLRVKEGSPPLSR